MINVKIEKENNKDLIVETNEEGIYAFENVGGIIGMNVSKEYATNNTIPRNWTILIFFINNHQSSWNKDYFCSSVSAFFLLVLTIKRVHIPTTPISIQAILTNLETG